MPRAGLTTERVVVAATDLVDRHGIDALTLTAIAEQFSVRPPSLYNHVGGLEDLTARVAVAALEDLADACRDATMGRAGPDALRALCRVYRAWALDHPGTYQLLQVARPDDPAWQRSAERVLAPISAVLSAMGIEGADAVHVTRSLRSALHGFVLLEGGGGFGIDLSLDESFERMVDLVVGATAEEPAPDS